MKIICDTREPEDLYKFLVREYPDIEFERSKLDEGDYLAVCNTGKPQLLVERKAIGDFYDSIMKTVELKSGEKKNRFRTQVDKITVCQADCAVLYLITGDQNSYVEGMKKLDIHIDRDIIDGGIASLIVHDNIRVLVEYSDKGGLKRMVSIMQKVCSGDHLDTPKVRNVNNLTARQLNINIKQWQALRDKHGVNLVYIAGLPVKELQKIEGIGKVKANKIKEILNGTSDDWL